MTNQNLMRAKLARKDEFFTLERDVAYELQHYDLSDKIVYCNCDHPDKSKFWKYLHQNYSKLKLAGLIATCIQEPFKYIYSGGDDQNIHAYSRFWCGCTDFRNETCYKIAEMCDILITNPPFSLFRDYLKLLNDIHKDFIVLGSVNCITYHGFIELLLQNKIYPGVTFNKVLEFQVPDDYELKATGRIDEQGNKFLKVPGICFFTSIFGMQVNTLKPDKAFSAGMYDHVGNYDAINVNKSIDIPCDYKGLMAVPVTYFGRFDFNNYKILGYTGGLCFQDINLVEQTKIYKNPIQHNPDGTICSGSKINTECAIISKTVPDKCYYTADNCDDYLIGKYGRLLIQKK